MTNGEFLTNRIFVYYKILDTWHLKSSSESQCLYSCSNIFDSTSIKLDSSDSEFMCTIIDSKNTLYVSDILHLLDNSIDSSKYVMFTKLLVPLDYLYPHHVDLEPLYELYGSNNSIPVEDDMGYNYNITTSPYRNKNDEYNLHEYDTEVCAKRFHIFTLSKNLKVVDLKSQSDSYDEPDNKKSPLVWVAVKLDDPIITFENKIYIKLYLSNTPKMVPHSHKVTTGDLLNTAVTCDLDLLKETNIEVTVNKHGHEKQYKSTKSKSATVVDQPLPPSDMAEITERIRKWSHTGDGKLKDIRSLLSTLQNVLLTDIKWEPMPISLLVGDKNSIKKYYKKALLTFHPDKLKFKSAKNRLFSELLIQTLIKSWNSSQ